jgi:AcrR family transcriptional regulator
MVDLESARRGTRRQRLSAEEVRAKMLQTAADAVLDSGLGISTEELSLEDLIQVARVPRSSVYRLWRYKDEFVDELLCFIAGPDGLLGSRGVFDQETSTVVRRTIAENRHRLSTADGRREVLCEAVRLGAGRSFRAQLSPRGRMWITLMAAVGSSKSLHNRSKIAAAFETSVAQSRNTIVGLLEYVMETLGLRMRDNSWTAAHLQTAGAAILQGLAMHYEVAQAAADGWSDTGLSDPAPPDQIAGQPVPGPGLDGQPAEWTLGALAYLGIVDRFLEPDPDFRVQESH